MSGLAGAEFQKMAKWTATFAVGAYFATVYPEEKWMLALAAFAALSASILQSQQSSNGSAVFDAKKKRHPPAQLASYIPPPPPPRPPGGGASANISQRIDEPIVEDEMVPCQNQITTIALRTLTTFPQIN